MQQEHHVGVLLDGAGLTQVGQHGPLVGALLGATVQLRDREHRNLELAGQQLEGPGELGDLLMAGRLLRRTRSAAGSPRR